MDANALSHLLKGKHDKHIETDSVCALISEAVQGTTMMEAYSCNIQVMVALNIQKDPKVMLVNDWVIM